MTRLQDWLVEGLNRENVTIKAASKHAGFSLLDRERLQTWPRKLFAEIESKARPDAILATNTSSLKLADIGAQMKDPSRLVGLHFFNPVPLMKLVEIVSGTATNPDWAKKGAAVGAKEFMDQAATDMNAQITKIKATGGDTLFLTTAVEQITLVMKQAQEQRLTRKIVTTGGSSSPTQLIKQAGAAAEGSYHIVFFMPWFPEAMPDGKLAKAFVDEWAKRGHPFEGLTEGFRGHDGIATIAEAIKVAGKDDPKAIRDALWKVSLMGVNGPIKFEKDGPAGKESGQSQPSIFVVQIRDGKVALPDFLAKK